jgi:hypothetical protein
MPRQTQHFKKLHGMAINILKYQLRAYVPSSVNYAEKDGNADAVNQFRIFEIYDERSATQLQLFAAFPFDPFTAKFIEIIARINNCQFTQVP